MKKIYEAWNRFLEQSLPQDKNIDFVINTMFQDRDLDSQKRPQGKPFRKRAQKYKAFVDNAAKIAGVDPALILAIMANESSMGKMKNYKGLMQLTIIARKDINEKRNGQYKILHEKGKKGKKDIILPVDDCKVLYPGHKKKTNITSGRCASDKKYYTHLKQNLEYSGGETDEVNILAGALYLKFIEKRIGLKDLKKRLCGYRHGPYAVRAGKHKNCKYAEHVLKFYKRSKRMRVNSDGWPSPEEGKQKL